MQLGMYTVEQMLDTLFGLETTMIMVQEMMTNTMMISTLEVKSEYVGFGMINGAYM
ncbi:hypothetical protein D3C84_1110270 [compost metagenome]